MADEVANEMQTTRLTDDVEARTYYDRFARSASWVTLLILVGGLVLVSISPRSPWWTAFAAAPVVGCLAYLNWRVFTMPRLVIDRDGIVVANPLKTHVLQWSELAAIEAGQWLVLRTTPGNTIMVWSVQATNLSLMAKRESHVDRVAAELAELQRAFANRTDDAPTDDRIGASQRDVHLQRGAWIFAIVILISLVIRLAVGT
jgi:hypothetical protein